MGRGSEHSGIPGEGEGQHVVGACSRRHKGLLVPYRFKFSGNAQRQPPKASPTPTLGEQSSLI